MLVTLKFACNLHSFKKNFENIAMHSLNTLALGESVMIFLSAAFYFVFHISSSSSDKREGDSCFSLVFIMYIIKILNLVIVVTRIKLL